MVYNFDAIYRWKSFLKRNIFHETILKVQVLNYSEQITRNSYLGVFLKILQYSLENTSARDSFLRKFAGLETFLRTSLWHKSFSVSFAIFLRTPFLQNTSDGCFWIVFQILNEEVLLLTAKSFFNSK